MMSAMNILISKHAIYRYQTRCKPHLDEAGAKQELENLIALSDGKILSGLPWNNTEPDSDRRPSHYLILSDGIALGLLPKGDEEWMATTTLTRAGCSPEKRQRRKQRRVARRTRKRKESKRKDPKTYNRRMEGTS